MAGATTSLDSLLWITKDGHLDMLKVPLESTYKRVVVISNDSDLKLPIEVAQNELGIRVGVINPHPPARRSRALQPTFFKQIRSSALAACQFAPVLADARGEIRKPSRW